MNFQPCLRTALAAVLLTSCARADRFESWHATDFAPFDWSRVELTIHTQVRTRQHFRDVFQARIGPVLRFPASPRVRLIAGYYFGEVEQSAAEWGNQHRTFGGFEVPVNRSSGNLSLRTLVEHHFGGQQPQAIRVREQARWMWKRPVAPFLATETYFDQHGWLTQRVIGGVRLPIGRRASADLSYIWDPRRASAGEHRHIISTTLRIERGE